MLVSGCNQYVFIDWSIVRGIRPYRTSVWALIGPADFRKLNPTAFGRFIYSANGLFGLRGAIINTVGTNLRTAKLIELLNAYISAYAPNAEKKIK